MDIEFHYYITYLIAVKAGFSSDEAIIISYSSQYVDDNDLAFEINKDSPQHYSNYVSQTINILKPKNKLFRIYPIFHFIPGNPLSIRAQRKDGKLHFLNTTPNSKNSQNIMINSLKTHNLYRIGIACHAYADTWAHQNFTGYFDEFNTIKGLLENAAPKIGHAGAGFKPDWPALIWHDCRLVSSLSKIDNKERFLDASSHLFEMLRRHILPTCTQQTINIDKRDLLKDLSEAIGGRDDYNSYKKLRTRHYQELSQRPEYGCTDLPIYNEYEWMDDAINEKVNGIRDRNKCVLLRLLPKNDVFTWKDINSYKESHWFRFQEAVKNHQKNVFDMLYRTTFAKMELTRW